MAIVCIAPHAVFFGVMLMNEVTSYLCRYTQNPKETWPSLSDPFRMAFRAQRANLEKAGSEYLVRK